MNKQRKKNSGKWREARKRRKASETITPVLDDMAKGDQALKSEFQSMFDMMYEQKQHYYPADNRFIVDYALEKNEEGFYLQVASTPFKAHNLAMAYISDPQ